MVLGPAAPPPGAIEVLTGAPFGAQYVELPFFDPPRWDPDLGLDAAIGLLGWTCERTSGGEPAEALARLHAESQAGPVLVGPVDIGLLAHQPWSKGTANGSDHWVVVLEVDDQTVVVHDPDGFAFSRLPAESFLAAWRAEYVEIAEPFVLRSRFRQVRAVDLVTALRRSVPAARRWLDDASTSCDAVHRLAAAIRTATDDKLLNHLTGFAVRSGARRLADASTWLAAIDAGAAAEITLRQAKSVGALQYPLVARELPAAAEILTDLAPTYGELRAALDRLR